MPIKPFIILCTLLYFPFLLIAQADKYQGTWQAIGILSGDSSNSYSITLQIAAGEKIATPDNPESKSMKTRLIVVT